MKMQNILNFCRRITKKQSKFEGVVVPRKTVLSIHFSNLFPQMTLNKWKENRNVLTPLESLIISSNRNITFAEAKTICVKISWTSCMLVLESLPKKESKEGVWWRAEAACKQMDEQMSRRRNELEAEFTRGLNQNGKLFHLENKSVFFLIVFVTSRQRCLQVSKSCSVLIKVIFYGSSSLQACNCDNKKHFKSIRSLRQSSIGPLIEEEKTPP